MYVCMYVCTHTLYIYIPNVEIIILSDLGMSIFSCVDWSNEEWLNLDVWMGSRDTENTKFEDSSEMFKWKTGFIAKFLDMPGNL